MKDKTESIRWICVQQNERPWFYEPSLALTRSKSIALLMAGWNLTWIQAKKKLAWKCVKVKVTLEEL